MRRINQRLQSIRLGKNTNNNQNGESESIINAEKSTEAGSSALIMNDYCKSKPNKNVVRNRNSKNNNFHNNEEDNFWNDVENANHIDLED